LKWKLALNNDSCDGKNPPHNTQRLGEKGKGFLSTVRVNIGNAKLNTGIVVNPDKGQGEGFKPGTLRRSSGTAKQKKRGKGLKGARREKTEPGLTILFEVDAVVDNLQRRRRRGAE